MGVCPPRAVDRPEAGTLQRSERRRPRRVGRQARRIGGAKGDRTPDLLHAMQALSQLSYGPGAVQPPAVFRILPLG